MKRELATFGCSIGIAMAVFAQTEEANPVFELGEVLVVGTRSDATPDSAAETVCAERLARQNRLDITEALSLLPDISIGRTGMRNEAIIQVRGFDLRQIPLFIDGIPVYLPYEGTVDTGRFLTFSASEISVSRGFSPIAFGPNTLGGAINVVSRRPTRPVEAVARGGVFSGNGLEGGLRGGLMSSNFYAQLSLAGRRQSFFRVSDDFTPAGAEDGGHRENSSRQDAQIGFKAAWTPSGDNEWAVGFVRQDSRKDCPPYAGTNPKTQARYWRYPTWEKNSLYAIGRQSVGADSLLKLRAYYDTYKNTLESFDDDTYSTQTRPYSFTSYYDDYTWGGGGDFETLIGAHHTPKVSVQYKRDVHREHNEGQSESDFSDATVSVGLEDTVLLHESWTLTAGVGYERRENIEAVDRSGSIPETFPDNHNDSFNPQAGLFYSISGGVFRATIAQKSRSPTLKDRYSYRRGQAIPNPGLDPEKAVHYEIGYEGRLIDTIGGRFSLFASRLRDTIQRVDNVQYDAATDTWLYQLQNVGESEHRGLEAGMDWTPAEWLKAGLDYALVDRRNISHPEIDPTDTPRHRVLASVEYHPWSRLTLIPDFEYNSWRYSTSDGVEVAGFWLVNLHVRLELPCGWEAGCGVRNVFDNDYELTEGYPEEGRNCYANVQYEF